MKRALIALLGVPLLFSALFGIYAFIVLPFVLIITIVLALPLFYLLFRLRWLLWWHACIAGVLCSFVFIALYWVVSPAYHIEVYGVRSALFFIALGAVVSLTFWWAGVFNNAAFPFVPSRFPRSMLILIPVATLGAWLHQRLDLLPLEGRVIKILEHPQKMPERSGAVQLRLSDGSHVVARLPLSNQDPSPVGQCFNLSVRWSITQTQKLYFLANPKFDEQKNDC